MEEKVKEEKKPEFIQSTSSLHHLLLVLTKTISFPVASSLPSHHVPRVSSLLESITALLNEALLQLKKHSALPSLTQPTLFFISEVLEQINENHEHKALYAQYMNDLLKIVNSLVTNKLSQAQALDTLYDVIIQGDCLKGNWKPILSCLKVALASLSHP